MLNQLKSANLVDVGAIVVRYFGGTKLGKAGLIEAYGNSTQEVIESAILQTIKLVQFFEVTYPYNQENLINKLVLNYGLHEQEATYTDDVTKTFACELAKAPQFLKELQTYAHLNIAFETGRKTYINADL